MGKKMKVVDKSTWTWQVMKRHRNESGDVIREERIGIPLVHDRALEVQTYKSTCEVRTGVTYFVTEVDPLAAQN